MNVRAVVGWCALWSLAVSSSGPASLLAQNPTWHRVAHSDVRNACISDGSARMQHYWDVAVYDWGGVVPLNSWYHPQLFHYDPRDAALRHVALAAPHEGMGNEDDPRMRLAVHRGDSADTSQAMFTIFGYEEIDGENGEHRRDTAVMALRTVEDRLGSAHMPRRTARVINMDPAEAKNGLGRISPKCGPVYDQQRQLVFVARDRTGDVENRELLQVFRFDSNSGLFQGRRSVRLPASMPTKHTATFADLSEKHGLLVVGATTPWSAKKSRSVIYLLSYAQVTDTDEFGDLQYTTKLTVPGLKNAEQATVEPTAAVFAEHHGHLWLIVAGGTEFTKTAAEFSAGLYVFDLGPIGGPHELSAPVKKIPIPHGVTELEVVDQQLVASARGLWIYDLAQLLAAKEEPASSPPRQVFPLPYDTHGFDFATIRGQRCLVLAGGRNGLDIFQQNANDLSVEEGDGAPANHAPANHAVVHGAPRTILRTGKWIRHFGAPAINQQQDLCVWAVTVDHREVILVQRGGQEFRELISTGEQIVSLGQPVINRRGQVAVWCGYQDGSQAAILLSADGKRTMLGGRDRYLSNVRLADDGRTAWIGANMGEHPNRSLAVTTQDDSRTVVYRENQTGKRHLGTLIHGDFAGDFDISPNGTVGVVVQHGSRNPHLYLWRSGVLQDLGMPGQHLQRIRFSNDSHHITCRLWKDEIICQARFRVGTPITQDPFSAAHRRSSYGTPPRNPGDFFAARANSAGSIVFATVENSQSGDGVRILGNQIWYRAADSSSPTFVVTPGQMLGEMAILHCRFEDAFSDENELFVTVDLSSNGRVQQALTVWNAEE
jgi:hypothetical protein